MHGYLPWLDRLVAVTIIVSSCAVIGAGVIARTHRGVRDGASPAVTEPPPAFAIGDRLPTADGVSFTKARRTVIVMVRTSSPFVADAMPFYQELAAQARAASSAQIVAAGDESRPALEAFVAAHNPTVDGVINNVDWMVGARMTPTVMIADEAGVLTGMWRGQPEPKARRNIEETLRLTAPATSVGRR